MKKFILERENKYIRSNQKNCLKKLYDLREENLRQIITLLNNPCVRDLNKEYMAKIQKDCINLYNSLTDIVSFTESLYFL